MGYTKLFKILENDTKLKSLITNLSSGYLDVPYIVSETLKVLDDESIFFNMISNSNKKSLCIMLDLYFNDCYELYIDDIGLDKMLKYGSIEVYKVDALDGLRYATVNEVAQGIKGLIAENIYPAGEEAYKNLCLLQWSFTGISYYFRQAGYKLNYSDDGKVTNTFYEMIQTSAIDLKNMFDWVSIKDNLDKSIKKIKKMQKSKGYKYASYAKDEISEDITIKQLVYNIYNVFPRNSENPEYRRALALSLKAYKNNKKLTPYEISSLRNIYDKHAIDINKNSKKEEVTNMELKKECEHLLAERYKGKINQNHFAYTIIDTLRKNNYTKCSPKQYSIIEDALKIVAILPNEEENKIETEVISDDEIDLSLDSLSNAIGDGLFDDEDDE